MTANKATGVQDDSAGKMPALSRLHDSGQTVAGSDEDIRGRMVKDKDGEDIGKIEHLLIDNREQKVRFMEVASGGFLHLGETKSFIPIEAITRIAADAVHISPTREHVAGAPTYDPDLVFGSAEYFFNLHPYYGYQGETAAPWITSWPYPKNTVNR